MFRFKQFSISQEKSAMKVGTDGVLLGAWVPVNDKKNILDIGAGTGLISLMIAQRNSKANIEALEIEKNAYTEADFNFKNSPWNTRLRIHHGSIQSFKSNVKYDLIVSNPPYFTDTHKNLDSKRTLARHVCNLSFNELLYSTTSLLSEKGACAFIIPFHEEKHFIALAKSNDLYISMVTRVKGKENLSVKRSLLYFTKINSNCKITELVIEIDRHVYTSDYIKLTQPFYLKM